jgi:hypothetical protein
MPNWARASQSANIMGTRSSAARYDRRIDLPRALPLWPHEIADDSVCGRKKIVAKLARALRAERRRGLAGHWTMIWPGTASFCASIAWNSQPAARCSRSLSSSLRC